MSSVFPANPSLYQTGSRRAALPCCVSRSTRRWLKIPSPKIRVARIRKRARSYSDATIVPSSGSSARPEPRFVLPVVQLWAAVSQEGWFQNPRGGKSERYVDVEVRKGISIKRAKPNSCAEDPSGEPERISIASLFRGCLNKSINDSSLSKETSYAENSVTA